MRLGEVRDLDFSAVASELEDLLYSQPFRVPAAFAFTGKAVGTLAGVATGLAPDLNLIDVAAPYARRFLGLSGDGAGQTAQQVLDQLTQSGRSLVTLPGRLERALTRLESGQIEIRIADGPPDGRAGRRGRARRTQGAAVPLGGASWALRVAAALAGGVVLLLNQLLVPGWFCLGLAALTLLLLTLRR
jgi:predicted unusual protein kinase regulating ubiquinone biosynthesis (AarF/ABC1/UbiB family)